MESKIAGRGMYWMGDEVGRCLREGRLESERMRLDVTLLQMKIFDEVSTRVSCSRIGFLETC